MSFAAVLKWTAISALLLGTTQEMRARHRAQREFTPPGRMVALEDGRRLQLDCRGSGSPTVVLESGLDHLGSVAWAAVHDSIARDTRVCAYSRAGLVWSDRAPGGFDSRRNARDLHAALERAGEKGPWVMVGHSIGVPYITTFTSIYDREVVGLVFVDGTHPEQFARWKAITGKSLQPTPMMPRVGSALAWTGLVRALPLDEVPANWPKETAGAPGAFLPVTLKAMTGEVAAISATLACAGEETSLGDRPLVVLAADHTTSADEARMMKITPSQLDSLRTATLAMRAEQASWSTRGRMVLVEGAGHYIQFDRPGAVVLAVREVVQEARGRVAAR